MRGRQVEAVDARDPVVGAVLEPALMYTKEDFDSWKRHAAANQLQLPPDQMQCRIQTANHMLRQFAELEVALLGISTEVVRALLWGKHSVSHLKTGDSGAKLAGGKAFWLCDSAAQWLPAA